MEGIANPKEYWTKRYAEQGYQTTGYSGHNAQQMDESYDERYQFLDENLPEEREYIFDYGCGVGRYFGLFDNTSYWGYDISEKAIELARSSHDLAYSDRFWNKWPLATFQKNILFTATVLQHNAEYNVESLLVECGFFKAFWLYEFTGKTNQPHMAQRSIEDYEKLVLATTGKKMVNSVTHLAHNQPHTLMIFE